MSTASTLLATGFLVNLRIHGEALGYIPADQALSSEWGEILTNEQASALLSSEEETAITGIFDEAYVNVTGAGGEVGTVEIAAIVKAGEVSGIQRGAFITRGGEIYFVKEAQTAAIDGSQVLLLSKHAH